MRTLRRAQPGEAGSASAWALLVTIGAFTVLFGLVVDGGAVLNARLDAARTADQAARAAADALSSSGLRNGTDRIVATEAVRRADDYLLATGHRGTVVVRRDQVTVTVTGTVPTTVLGVIGVDSFDVHEVATARGITSGEER